MAATDTPEATRRLTATGPRADPSQNVEAVHLVHLEIKVARRDERGAAAPFTVRVVEPVGPSIFEPLSGENKPGWPRLALWAGFGAFLLADTGIVGLAVGSSWFDTLGGVSHSAMAASTQGLSVVLTAAVAGSFALLTARVREATALMDDLAEVGRRLDAAEGPLRAIRQFREARRAPV